MQGQDFKTNIYDLSVKGHHAYGCLYFNGYYMNMFSLSDYKSG